MKDSDSLSKLIDRAGRVAVLYGGLSTEREISLASGGAIIRALSETGFDVHPIDINDNPLQQIVSAKPDVAFIALHGPGGEDGKIQALLEFLKIPYTGSGVAASALCMDKIRTKHLWKGMGLPTPGYMMLNAQTIWEQVFELGEEIIVKPSREGSSFGVARVNTVDELIDAYRGAAEFDPQVLAERFISGCEYTVAVLGAKPLPPIRLETDNNFYDFEAKYKSSDTRYICPCGLSEQREAQLKSLAVDAFHAVGASGWGRVDIMSEGENFYLLEVNTSPGMTSHSLVPMAANAMGLEFNQLVIEILKQVIE